MKELRWITILTITIGIISIFFGWTQTWEYAYDGTNDHMFTIRTVRAYVFIVGGFILIIVGVLFGAVRKYVESLELKIGQLKQEIEKKVTTTQAPIFRYWDEEGKEHEVGFEDARSIQAKFDMIKELGLRGISYWKLGLAFPQNWLLSVTVWKVIF